MAMIGNAGMLQVCNQGVQRIAEPAVEQFVDVYVSAIALNLVEVLVY